jgi:hypothetical protein
MQGSTTGGGSSSWFWKRRQRWNRGWCRPDRATSTGACAGTPERELPAQFPPGAPTLPQPARCFSNPIRLKRAFCSARWRNSTARSTTRTVLIAPSMASRRCSIASSRPIAESGVPLGQDALISSAALAEAVRKPSRSARCASFGCTVRSIRSIGRAAIPFVLSPQAREGQGAAGLDGRIVVDPAGHSRECKARQPGAVPAAGSGREGSVGIAAGAGRIELRRPAPARAKSCSPDGSLASRWRGRRREARARRRSTRSGWCRRGQGK